MGRQDVRRLHVPLWFSDGRDGEEAAELSGNGAVELWSSGGCKGQQSPDCLPRGTACSKTRTHTRNST